MWQTQAILCLCVRMKYVCFFNTHNAVAFNSSLNGIYIFNLFINILCKCVRICMPKTDFITFVLQSHLISVGLYYNVILSCSHFKWDCVTRGKHAYVS